MDAVSFLTAMNRMCEFFYARCARCGLSGVNNRTGESCDIFCKKYPEEAVAIVEKWSKEHPVKTRQSEFLKMFPDARVVQGTLGINPCQIEYSRLNTEECHTHMDNEAGCLACREEYWNAEVSDNAD